MPDENNSGSAPMEPLPEQMPVTTEAPAASNTEPAADPTMPRQTRTSKKSAKPKTSVTASSETKEKKMKTATKKAAPAKKAVAKKAAAPKKQVATGADRKRYADDMVIKITDQERADKMRADSRRHVSFKKIKPGMTVDKYIKAGGDRLDLNIMDKLGIVSVK